MVCHHRSCLRNGSEAVYDAFQKEKAAVEAPFFVSKSDCTGQCSSGPTVRVMPDQTWYCQVKPENVPQIVEEHIQKNTPVTSLLHPRLHPQAMAFDSDASDEPESAAPPFTEDLPEDGADQSTAAPLPESL